MKNFLTNDSEIRFNEVVFENRHKNYGAYVLRSEENNILKKSFFIGVSLFVTIAAMPLIISNLNFSKPVTEKPLDPTWVELPPENPVKPEDPVKPVQPPKQEIVKEINTVVPTPTSKPIIETPPAKVDDYDHAIAGTKNVEGIEKPVEYVKPVNNTPTSTAPTQQPPVDDNTPKTVVDVEASFNGGINAFRSKVQGNFDVSDFEGTGDILSTTVTFIVERDGTISSVKANGKDAKFNAEAEKTIRSIKGKWIPAEVKGQAVRSFFRFPISMQLE